MNLCQKKKGADRVDAINAVSLETHPRCRIYINQILTEINASPTEVRHGCGLLCEAQAPGPKCNGWN